MRPRDALVHACLDGACLAAPACPHHAFPARGLRGGLRTFALAATRHACALTWRSPSCEHRRAEYEAANSSNFDCVYPADAHKVRNTYELLLISSQRAFEEEACVNSVLPQRPLLPADLFHLWRSEHL